MALEKAKAYVKNIAGTKSFVSVFEEGSAVLARRGLPAFSAKEARMKKFYSQLIDRGDLCFDVGANVGNFAQVFLDLGSRVVCVEPQQVCLRVLKKRFRNNRNVAIVGKAVGAVEGSAELMVCDEANTVSTMSQEWVREGPFSKQFKWAKTVTVPVTTLDCLIFRYGLPKYCKIDVEGFELQVLKGLSQPMELVSFEFTKGGFLNAKKCVERLVSIGYGQFNVMLREAMKFQFQKWLAPNELYGEIGEMSRRIDGALLWGDIYARSSAPRGCSSGTQELRCKCG